jgi:Tfp pilus assembly protein PilZ/CheY-like chemotaxis protein
VTRVAHSLVVLGELDARAARVIDEAAAAAGVEARHVAHPADLAQTMDAREPLALLLRSDADASAQACAEVRSKRRFAHIPILGVSARRSDASFIELYQWGADDLIALDTSTPLLRRLRGLRASPPSATMGSVAPRGDAIIAGGDVQWATVLARSLSSAGLTPRFVASASDAIECANDACVVIAMDDLAPEGAVSALLTARKIGLETPWVIVAPPKRANAVQASIATHARVAVVDAFAPPENVLFVVNDLARVGVDQRTSPRLLFGTPVMFRAAGREDEDEIGFTYNVSGSGLFVRTLAPLEPKDEIWLELCPPRSPRRLRLSGKVAWRRRFGPNETATVPPGFGVHIQDGLGGDLERWRAGCEALLNDALSLSQPPAVRARPSLALSSLITRVPAG